MPQPDPLQDIILTRAFAAASSPKDEPETLVPLLANIKVSAVSSSGLFDSWTLLHAAAQAGHVRDVQLLLARGADANARDKKGETPLLKAAARGQTAVCRLLLQARGDPAAASSSGATALSVAADKPDVRALLESPPPAAPISEPEMGPITDPAQSRFGGVLPPRQKGAPALTASDTPPRPSHRPCGPPPGPDSRPPSRPSARRLRQRRSGRQGRRQKRQGQQGRRGQRQG